MPRLLAPLATLPRVAPGGTLRDGEAREPLLGVGEQPGGLGERFLRRQSVNQRIGELGFDQLADVGRHPDTVDRWSDMATFPFLMLLAVAQAPPARAREVATHLPFAYSAYLEVRREAGAIGDPALRSAVEAQLLTPWLPPEAWAYAHLAEARKLLGD